MSKHFNQIPASFDSVNIPPKNWCTAQDQDIEARVIGTALMDFEHRPQLVLECFQLGAHRAAWREILKAATIEDVSRDIFDKFEHKGDPMSLKADVDYLAGRYLARNGMGHGLKLIEHIGPSMNAERRTAELKRRIQEAETDPANPPPPDAPVFYVTGKLVSTCGNLSALVAPAKTGKTAIIGAHVAACLVAAGLGSNDTDTLGITSEPPQGKAVLILDTEQSPHHACKLIERSLSRVGLETQDRPEWLRLFTFAGWKAKDLADGLPLLLEDAAQKHSGIHAVFVDGGADFAANVNDPEEAAELVAGWHSLAIKHRCSIVLVIHSNEGSKADEVARGWLGKQLRRKAESNLQLKRDGDAVVMFGEAGQRHAPIFEKEGPRFAWSDKAGMHVSVSENPRANKKYMEFSAMAAEVYAGKESMAYNELFNAIKASRGCAKSTAENSIKSMLKLGVIKSGAMGRYERNLE